MEKKFNGAPLDLVALDNGMPAFWVETKCTFRSAGDRSFCDVAIDALAKIQDYSDRLGETTWREVGMWRDLTDEIHAFQRAIVADRCPAYIVNFVTSAPGADSGLPQFVTRKFPTQKAFSAQQLQRLYAPQGALGDELKLRKEKLQNMPNGQTTEAKSRRCESLRIDKAIRAYGRLGASCIRSVLLDPAIDAVVVKFRPDRGLE